jgi:transcriptional regulator with XRE-family HTH domain
MNNENCVNIIGPYVQKLREERGWSLERLAQEFCHQGILVDSQTLKRVEMQQEVITEHEIIAFATVLRASVIDLFPPNPTAPEFLEQLQEMARNAPPAESQIGFILAGDN